MNIPFTLKTTPRPAFAAAPFQVVIRFVRFALQQLVRSDDPAALRYAADKNNGEID